MTFEILVPDRFEDISSSGRQVAVTSPRQEGRSDDIERPPLVTHPLIGKTGLLPTMGTPEAAMQRFAGAWRIFAGLGLRVRQMVRHEQGTHNEKLLEVSEKEEGRYIEISINNEGDENQFRKVAGFVASKLLKRGYNDEHYYSFLSEDRRQTEGHVGLIRNCAYVPGEIARCFNHITADSFKNVQNIVREAFTAAYEIIGE